jgi:hypothetical protein
MLFQDLVHPHDKLPTMRELQPYLPIGKLTKYVAARSAALYRITTEFAAQHLVDLERAKNDMKGASLDLPMGRDPGAFGGSAIAIAADIRKGSRLDGTIKRMNHLLTIQEGSRTEPEGGRDITVQTKQPALDRL